MKNPRRNLIRAVLILVIVGMTMGMTKGQTVISVESAENIKNGTTVWINITAVNISDLDGIGSYRFNLTFDPSVVNVLDIQSPLGVVTKNINNGMGWAKFNQFLTPSVKENGTILAKLQLKAMRGDGASSSLNLSIERLYDPNGNPIPSIAINGTFTTLDEVPPTISFNKANGSTVGPELDVVAMIFDLSGINASSIEVYINGTKLANGTDYTVSKINDTTWNVNVKTNVSQFLNVALPHDVEIEVIASDTKGNTATAVLLVTAANIGFFNPYPPDNGYINTSSVVISVKYSQINPDTIRMFLDGVNVTSDISIISIDQVNGIVSYNATNLSDGSHTVKVNGTGGDGNESSKEWSFIVDTVKPTILLFQVKDSDGDGFIERNEDLTACWNVSDANFDRVEILYNGEPIPVDYADNLTKANASATFSLTEYGGYITLKVYDKAGNVNVSSNKFYVYNNYVAYVIRSQPKEVAGLNITKLATLDVVDPSVVYYEFIGASGFTLPLQNAERIIIPGTKANYTAIVDENANKTISQFPSTAVVYDENSMLDFYIKAPAKGLIMVVKLNDSEAKDMAKDLLEKRSLKGFSLENLTDLMDYAYIFDEEGWIGAKYNKDENQFEQIGQERGTFPTPRASINELIAGHSVDISNGFRLSDHDTNYSRGLPQNYPVRPVLEKGYYALIVIGIDNDITALDLVAPFIALNGTIDDNAPSAEKEIMLGDKVKIEFPVTFNAASAVMLKKADYNARVEMNLAEKLLEIANVTLSYQSKNLREIRPFNKSTNIWVPEGMFKAAFTTKDVRVLEIDTSGLETGEYIIYVVAIDKDFMTLYAGELTVTLTQDNVPPKINITVKSANATAILLHYKFTDNNLLDKAYMKATYPDNNVSVLVDETNIRKEVFEGDATLNVSFLSEGQAIEIYAEATDVSGNSAAAKLTVAKPVTANSGERRELKPATDVAVELVAGANNTTVTILATVAKKPEEVNVTKNPPLTPIKFVKVDAKIVNGSVSRWILEVTYTDQEIAGLDENTLRLLYWDDANQTWKNLRDYVGKWIDSTHFVYSYQHNTAANRITVVLSNLSVFSLVGQKLVVQPPPTFAGEGGYAITPTPTPTATPIVTPTPVVTPVTPTSVKTPVPTPTPTLTPTPVKTPKPTPTPPPPPVPSWIWIVVAIVVVVIVLAAYKARKK